jgi:hypothetical protein
MIGRERRCQTQIWTDPSATYTFDSRCDQDILSQISELNANVQREWDERRKEKISESRNFS